MPRTNSETYVKFTSETGNPVNFETEFDKDTGDWGPVTGVR